LQASCCSHVPSPESRSSGAIRSERRRRRRAGRHSGSGAGGGGSRKWLTGRAARGWGRSRVRCDLFSALRARSGFLGEERLAEAG